MFVFLYRLAELTDTIGPRMSGSQALEDAIDFVLGQMKAAGLPTHTQNVSVPHWERGFEQAQLLTPRNQTLNILGLGGSVSTPPGGITADIVAVETFEEFDRLSRHQVEGKIVVFVPTWKGYGKTVGYRNKGPSIASRKGAVAALIRSITPFSIASPHTGWQEYDANVTKIPAASLTVEDAELLLRLYRRNVTARMHLELNAKTYADAISRNTIAELKGEQDRSVVVLSGHIDSWDVGVGALDDGGGSYVSWKALELLKSLGLRTPKRTIRAILWTAEEQGLFGAVQYAEQFKLTEKEEFNFFMESDQGTFRPLGLDFSGNAEAECIFREVLSVVGAPLNATKFDSPIDAGPDIEVWAQRGFPSASLLTENDKYFYWHHSAGDTMSVLNSEDLDKNCALFAAAAYVIADLSVDMPKSDISPLTKFQLD